MNAPHRIVIVGGGLAAAKSAEHLRGAGFTGELTVIGDEPHLPYQRPPLLKGYLAGTSGFDEAIVHPQSWYDEQHVDLRLGRHVSAIDPAAHRITLDRGDVVAYDKLLLATGSAPRRLDLPGADADGVLYMRRREDSDAVRAIFGPGRRLAIIGAGWIGLEVAAQARQAGTDVTVIEVAQLPLLGVLGADLARLFADLHRGHGVDLRLGTKPVAITVDAAGHAAGIRLADGSTIHAGAVLIGVGAVPDVTLAQQAGLAVDNGVLVDASLRTSDPDIYAAGDIANHQHPILGTRIRVEHWATALTQPATAAKAMLGHDATYTDLPYFFTDQYDLSMEYTGHVPRDTTTRIVIRGDLTGRIFVAFWLDENDRIKAAMNVNTFDVADAVKPLIAGGIAVDPKQLADPTIDYHDLSQ